MKKLILTAATAAAALLGVVPASADRDETVRSFQKRLPVEAGATVNLDIPVGEVRVQASDDRQVSLDVRLTCDNRGSRCAELAKKVRVVYSTEGDGVAIQIKDWPKMSTRGLEAHIKVTMPRDVALDVELGVGELEIAGIEANVDAELGVGEVKVSTVESAIGSVNLDTGVGEAVLRAGGRRYESSGLVAKELKWRQGPGRSHVEVDCGVGEISVTLE